MITALDRARGCLTARGLRAVGEPVLPPSPPGSTIADGEILLSSSIHPTFIAFYTDAGRARRLEPRVVQNARRVGGQVERRGAVTILWTHTPTRSLRGTVEGCAFR